ncbi:Fucose permease [Anoxynatronum buryatiense]|uniref:Fucose permease n=2 Tax=Anoxynatronum buryatiense TaxID=489973 RepID=A0AA45WWX0_9CLOT|nr:Fucose permease [Anoxynatronum buryatiense]
MNRAATAGSYTPLKLFLFLSFFIMGVSGSQLAALLPEIRHAFQISFQQAGSAMAGLSAGLLISMFAGIFIMDRLNRKKTLILGGILWATGFAMMIFATEFHWFLAGLTVTGSGFGLYQTGASVTMATLATRGKGKEVGYLNLFFGLGAVVAPLLATWTVRLGNWRLAYGVCLVMVIIMQGLLLRIHFPETVTGGSKHSKGFSGLLLLIGLLAFAYPLTEQTVGSWISEYWFQAGNQQWVPYSLIPAVFWMTFTIGRGFSGRLADKMGYERYLTGVLTGYVLVTAVWVLFPSPVMTLFMLPLMGLLLAGVFPVIVVLISDAFPQSVGSATSVVFTFLALGSVLAPRITGNTIEQTGVTGLPVILLAGAVVSWLLSTVILLWRRQQTKGQVSSMTGKDVRLAVNGVHLSEQLQQVPLPVICTESSGEEAACGGERA